jgi:hypothetical protein
MGEGHAQFNEPLCCLERDDLTISSGPVDPVLVSKG